MFFRIGYCAVVAIDAGIAGWLPGCSYLLYRYFLFVNQKELTEQYRMENYRAWATFSTAI